MRTLEKRNLLFGSAVTMIFIMLFYLTTVSFALDEDSLIGPGALVVGMSIAITYLVKRDKDMREKIESQHSKIEQEKDRVIAEQQKEIQDLRERIISETK